jgi:hypothetical protein
MVISEGKHTYSTPGKRLRLRRRLTLRVHRHRQRSGWGCERSYRVWMLLPSVFCASRFICHTARC